MSRILEFSGKANLSMTTTKGGGFNIYNKKNLKRRQMRHKILIALPILLIFLGGCVTQKITREDIEWSDFWWGHESDTTKPRVLFIGNSISRGYYPVVSTKLSGVANCDQYATSRSIEDPALFRETKMAMAKYHHAVIHFNNGLHGWHLTKKQ